MSLRNSFPFRAPKIPPPAPPSPPVYVPPAPVVTGSDGQVWPEKIVKRIYEVATDSSGTWSVDYSALGFKSLPDLRVEVISTGALLSAQLVRTITEHTLTRASGKVVALGLSLGFAGAGRRVIVTVEGPV